MARSRQVRNLVLSMSLRAALAALAMGFVLMVVTAQAQAQTYKVIHDFTGIGTDGAAPMTGLSMDAAGNLYGTTQYGGGGGCFSAFSQGCGTVFRLSHKGSGWVYAPLYDFAGWPNNDGAYPLGRVIIGPDGSLYGTTAEGGEAVPCFALPGCGIVFNLRPPPTRPATVLSPWTETIVYRFQGPPDGSFPHGELTFDRTGNLYGATDGGGAYGTSYGGTVFELTHSNGGWTESILYSFREAEPLGGVAFDQIGNLYGTTLIGGANDFGIVFQLSPSGSGWTLNTLHNFGSGNDGLGSYGGVIVDKAGNLYGATVNGNPSGDAAVYQMSPSNGGWTYNEIYSFAQSYGGGPAAQLIMDAAGNLYGTTRGVQYSNNPYGSVFKLTPSNGGWTYTDLYDFTGGDDGSAPYSSLVLDAQGNLYGTAFAGGTSLNCQGGCGVVFQITP